MLDLYGCVDVPLVAESRGLSPAAVCEPLAGATSPVVKHRLQGTLFSAAATTWPQQWWLPGYTVQAQQCWLQAVEHRLQGTVPSAAAARGLSSSGSRPGSTGSAVVEPGLWSTGSRAHCFQQLQHVASAVVAPGLWSTGSAAVVHGFSCSIAYGILPDQGLNPRLLQWQADSLPLSYKESPTGKKVS